MPMTAALSLVALLIAVINTVIAGALLTESRRQRWLFLVAAGPLGVALFSYVWFLWLADPKPLRPFSSFSGPAAGAAGVIAMSGFAAEWWLALGPKTRRFSLAGSAVLIVVGLGLARYLRPDVTLLLALPLVLGDALTALTWGAATFVATHGSPDRRAPARRVARAIVLVSILAVTKSLFAEYALHAHERSFQSSWVILVAEVLSLLQILERRVEIKIVLSRAVSYAILAILVTFAATLTVARFGFPLNTLQIASSVILALISALLFLTLGDRASAWLETVLFPEHSGMVRQLAGIAGGIRGASAEARESRAPWDRRRTGCLRGA
jgi:hypothetical protein